MTDRHPVIIVENPCYTTKGGYIVSPNNPPLFIKQERSDLKEIIARFNERLDEPFVSAGTVTGAKGIAGAGRVPAPHEQ